jgi:hypothetical protein
MRLTLTVDDESQLNHMHIQIGFQHSTTKPQIEHYRLDFGPSLLVLNTYTSISAQKCLNNRKYRHRL